MTVKLFNINWPEELRDSFSETITKLGGRIRTAKHKDNESDSYFYLIEVTNMDTITCLKVLQESFKFYYTKHSPKEHYGFTFNNYSYVADLRGNICVCEALRAVSVPEELAEEVITSYNHISESVWYLSYGECCDFYLLDGDLLNLIPTIKHQQDMHYTDTVIRDLTYVYNDRHYTYPATPEVLDKKPVKNYTLYLNNCPTEFIKIIEKLLIWDSIPASHDTKTTVKAPATKAVIIESLNRAYAVYLNQSSDTHDYLIDIDTVSYVFSYYRRRLIAVVGHKNIVDTGDNMKSLKEFLDYEGIYQNTINDVWYIEHKRYREFIKKGEELLKSNGTTFTWSA